MESEICPLSWPYLYQSMDELRYSLLYTTLELETTRLDVQEEIKKREHQVTHLKDLLNSTIKERDESRECQRLLTEKFLLFQHQATPLSAISSIEDETRRGDFGTGISSLDCEESVVSSSVVPAPSATRTPTLLQLASEKSLPEKGSLLQAVIKAGPLLQTLLLAGPLPQWQHPPPQLDSIDIPPVAIPSPPLLNQDSSTYIITNNNPNGDFFNQKKRLFTVYEGSDSSTNVKYQRVALR